MKLSQLVRLDRTQIEPHYLTFVAAHRQSFEVLFWSRDAISFRRLGLRRRISVRLNTVR